jgi:hypothetical protein
LKDAINARLSKDQEVTLNSDEQARPPEFDITPGQFTITVSWKYYKKHHSSTFIKVIHTESKSLKITTIISSSSSPNTTFKAQGSETYFTHQNGNLG